MAADRRPGIFLLRGLARPDQQGTGSKSVQDQQESYKSLRFVLVIRVSAFHSLLLCLALFCSFASEAAAEHPSAPPPPPPPRPPRPPSSPRHVSPHSHPPPAPAPQPPPGNTSPPPSPAPNSPTPSSNYTGDESATAAGSHLNSKEKVGIVLAAIAAGLQVVVVTYLLAKRRQMLGMVCGYDHPPPGGERAINNWELQHHRASAAHAQL
ncbi:hypothetical protein CY35_02G082900 [Sphagnum magellanicum]|nr:hypothetical protein CY35_02G082900 [Sphagnum magellanicum]